ncbi:unnamed protein product [Pleuronectes platessa]|uniref:Uncharacterized protein n=1 Tax=Pleuronectes platessa TaxID=8262 RepID=A0A9N7VFT8_PLEPL|nr:unnamed protein product [Pleuronectes platessa]
MDNKSEKLKSLEVEAATFAKLTDLFGAGFTSPAAAGAPGDERGGLDNDERVEADMVDHLTCESLRSCSPSVHVRGLALCLPPLSAFTVVISNHDTGLLNPLSVNRDTQKLVSASTSGLTGGAGEVEPTTFWLVDDPLCLLSDRSYWFFGLARSHHTLMHTP